MSDFHTFPNEKMFGQETLDLDMFQIMNEETARQYYESLFAGALDTEHLHSIWSNVPHDMSTTLKMDWAVSAAVDYIEEVNAALISESDNQLASQILRTEHRREARKRQKERKKATEEKENITRFGTGKGLTGPQLECFLCVRDVLSGSTYHYSLENVCNAVLQHNFNGDAAIEELLNFGVVQSDFANAVKQAPVEPPSAAKNKKKVVEKHVSSYSAAVDERIETGDHTVIRGNNATVSHSGPSVANSSGNSSSSGALQVSPLHNYFLTLLRLRNPGIQVRLDGECMVYKGTQRDYCVISEAGELHVSIDLHGQTRKPAVDLMQSSLLHYHQLLSTKEMNHYAAPAGVLRRSSKAHKANKPACKSLFAEVKCVRIMYVVGQGLHSVGAVPVLRNTLMEEVSTYWSMFDAAIDVENQGQIVVRVRRL
eukprot:gene7489-8983_t